MIRVTTDGEGAAGWGDSATQEALDAAAVVLTDRGR